tara:strand:+ start:1023 stop:1682 length:660 start_codon:yes stop_codon:yes gene_type:complete
MAFATIDVTKGITGTIPVTNGGTGLASGTSGQFLKFTGSTTVASAAAEGITVCDHWYLASSTDNGTNGIIADSSGSGANGGAWTKYQSATSSVTTVTTGSGGGRFSFPTTGMYLITGNFTTYHNADDNDMGIAAYITTNDFSATSILGYIRNSFNSTDGTPNAYHQGSNSFIFDVTDTSNCKFRWYQTSVANNNYVYGANSGGDGIFGTTCIIMRIGNT